MSESATGSMDRKVEGFHHRPKGGASHDYGDRHVAAMVAEIEKYPRYKIAALKKEPVPRPAYTADPKGTT